ncbi:MAG TPA: hypothetical protein VN812_11540 [Candidatus Acidoferrales bacterium]|nr:hypothetical protein [Candidatus Acidoferrales bacterium]
MTDDDDHAAALLTIHRCGYRSPCRAPRCSRTATVILRKAESNGRFLRQIELCDGHGDVAVARERARGLAIVDRR